MAEATVGVIELHPNPAVYVGDALGQFFWLGKQVSDGMAKAVV